MLNGLPIDQWPSEEVMFGWVYARLKPCRLLSRVVERIKESKKSSKRRTFEYVWAELEEILAEAREDSNEQALKDSLRNARASKEHNNKDRGNTNAAAKAIPAKPPKGPGKGNPKSKPKPPAPPPTKAAPVVTDQGVLQKTVRATRRVERTRVAYGKGKGDPKSPPPAPPGSEPAKAKQPCFFYPKGTCTRGKDCPYAHVDDPSATAKAAASKANPKVPGGVALLVAASAATPASAQSTTTFASGLRATARLLSYPFRAVARVFAAISICMPATVHHDNEHVPGNVSRTGGGSYCLEWVADSGAGRSLLSQSALAEQGIVESVVNQYVSHVQQLQFETGNGITSSSSLLTTTSDAFGPVESYVLQQCPVVRSVGQLAELQQKPFVWLPGHKPFFGCSPESVQVTWARGEVIEACRVDDFVPVFREEVKFVGSQFVRSNPAVVDEDALPSGSRDPAPSGTIGLSPNLPRIL